MKRLFLILALIVISGCEAYPPGYCEAEVKAYEECRADADCWSRRFQWGTSEYMHELQICRRRVWDGKP